MYYQEFIIYSRGRECRTQYRLLKRTATSNDLTRLVSTSHRSQLGFFFIHAYTWALSYTIE